MDIGLVEIITGVLVALNAGQVVMYFVNRRKHNADSMLVESQSETEIASASETNAKATAVIVDQMQKILDASTKKIDELQKDLDREKDERRKMKQILNEQIALSEILQKDIDELHLVYFNMPFPQWLKDNNGVMKYLNSHYERVFLIPQNKTSKDYIGYDDVHMWGEIVGNQYRENDNKVKESAHGYWRGTEDIPSSKEKWDIIKYPMYIRGEYKGIAGIAMPIVNYG